MSYRFHITKHEAERLDLRNISWEEVKSVVCSHDRKQDEGRGRNGGRVWKFFKMRKSLALVVVAEIKKSERWVVTSYETN